MSKKQSLGILLDRCRNTIYTVKANNGIMQCLATYGFTDQRITEGWNLYVTVTTSFERQKKENAESYVASKAYLEEKEAVISQFRKDVKILRIAAKGNMEISQLIPDELSTTNSKEFQKTARVLYLSLANTPAYAPALATVGFKPSDFAERISSLDGLDALRAVRDREEAESVTATSIRDKEFDELQAFCKDLRTIAKIAVEGEPTLKRLVNEL